MYYTYIQGLHTPALVSVVVVLVALVRRVPVARRGHLRDDLAAELGLDGRDDLLRRLLLLLGVVEDGAPGELGRVWLGERGTLVRGESRRDMMRT